MTTAPAKPRADAAEIGRAFDLFVEPGGVVELRALRVAGRDRTDSGYYSERAAFIRDAVKISGNASGVYVTMNGIAPSLLARRANRFEPWAKPTTADHDVITRRWILIDLDAVRPAGISSSDREHAQALDRSRRAWRRLEAWGVPESAMIAVDSGNGAHILIRVDLPNNDDAHRLVEGVLRAAAFTFDDEAVTVDTSVANAARIVKLPGTETAKGDDVPDRPHRIASILRAPEPQDLETCPREVLKGIAAIVPVEPPRQPRGSVASDFDLEHWIAEHNLDVGPPKPWKDGMKWIFNVCPWNPEHDDDDAYLVRHGSGAIAHGCQHNGCADKRWQDLRELYEPRLQATGQQRHEEPADTPSEGGGGFRWRSATEIAEMTPETPEWIAQPYVARGAVTELSAKIKTGKTTIMLSLVNAVRRGEPFLGQPTTRTPVVILTEERPSTFRAAMARTGLLDAADIHVLFRSEANGTPWPDVVDAARAKAHEVGAGLLIVDTLSDWASIAGDEENSSGAALEAMRPVHAAAADGLAVIIVRHDRKSGGDVGDSARGSSAFGGAADVLLSLRRADGQGHPDRRVLHAVGRFDDIPPHLVIELRDGQYVPLGDEAAIEVRAARMFIAYALREAKEPLTEKQILDKIGDQVSRSTFQRAIKAMCEDQEATKSPGFGASGRAYGYALSNEVPNLGIEGWAVDYPHGSQEAVRDTLSNEVPNPAPLGQSITADEGASNEVPNPQSLNGHSITPPDACALCGDTEVAAYSPDGDPLCATHTPSTNGHEPPREPVVFDPAERWAP